MRVATIPPPAQAARRLENEQALSSSKAANQRPHVARHATHAKKGREGPLTSPPRQRVKAQASLSLSLLPCRVLLRGLLLGCLLHRLLLGRFLRIRHLLYVGSGTEPAHPWARCHIDDGHASNDQQCPSQCLSAPVRPVATAALCNCGRKPPHKSMVIHGIMSSLQVFFLRADVWQRECDVRLSFSVMGELQRDASNRRLAGVACSVGLSGHDAHLQQGYSGPPPPQAEREGARRQRGGRMGDC